MHIVDSLSIISSSYNYRFALLVVGSDFMMQTEKKTATGIYYYITTSLHPTLHQAAFIHYVTPLFTTSLL